MYYMLSVGIIMEEVGRDIIEWMKVLMIPVKKKIITLSIIEYYIEIITLIVGISIMISIPIMIYQIYMFRKPGREKKEEIKGKGWIIIGPWIYYIIIQEAMMVWMNMIPEGDIEMTPTIRFISGNIIMMMIIGNIMMMIPYIIRGKDIEKIKKIWYGLIMVLGIMGPPDIIYMITVIIIITMNIMGEILIRIRPLVSTYSKL